MENHLAVMNVRSRPGSDIDMLCDFGPHFHPFCALGFSSVKRGALAVLRASDALILQVPSTEVLES